jgi:transposase
MFIRKNKNRSGSISIQIVQKVNRRNVIVKTIGVAKSKREEELLSLLAKQYISSQLGLQSLFVEHDDLVVENFVQQITNDHFQCVGPELILGKIYEKMGLPNSGSCELLKHLVLCRLVSPGSKLHTVEYLRKHCNQNLSVYSIYRYLDTFDSSIQPEVETAIFNYTKNLLGGNIGVVFYDMTTLYFETSESDDYRVPGFNKDGKHQHPQIMIGLLVSSSGLPVGYQIFEGNTAETSTLIPVLEQFAKRFGIEKPVVVADAALLSKTNQQALHDGGYQFILGGRLKNESQQIKREILKLNIQEGKAVALQSPFGRIVIGYSSKRAKKDYHNRQKGLKRLEEKVRSGKLNKAHINNRGYNKYLKIEGTARVSIDYNLYQEEAVWDGLKGYVTNTLLEPQEVIQHYSQLWQIEKAFRISKTDLRIRPIYHRIKHRIEAHICLCFAAYAIYKELERILKEQNVGMSVEKAIEEIKQIRKLSYVLPNSREQKAQILKPTELQEQLLKMEI